jgi:Secretion system C-terminal sorting domain
MKKIFYNPLNFILMVFLYLSFALVLQASDLPKKYGAHLAKKGKRAQSIRKPVLEKGLQKTTANFWQIGESGLQLGHTFEVLPFDAENGIKKFNRDVARTILKRDLFGLPQYSATYYRAKYDKNALFVESTLLQVVSDSRWNRLLYGALNGSLKSYEQIIGPGEITVSPLGKIFVAEKGKSRIIVFEVEGKGAEAKLTQSFIIDGINEPTSLAYNDGGTPFDGSDDFLFVADASKNTIGKWQIGENAASLSKTYKGFRWPVSIAIGRWDGVNTNQLYVVDSYAKKVTLFEELNGELNEVIHIKAKNNQTFSKVETDHFGQIYLADAVNGNLFKLSANLDMLDKTSLSQNKGINDLAIPFGLVEIEGEGKYWAGFDQLFALQTWDEESGVERLKLGLSLQDSRLNISQNNARLEAEFKITDFAETRFTIFSRGNKKIFESEKIWNASGTNMLTWQRRDQNNAQVAPGNYSFELEVSSAYSDEAIIQKTSFYLPLYYHVDCGNEDATGAVTLIRGKAQKEKGISFVQDDERVVYSISGLEPGSSYKIAAAYFITENSGQIQDLLIDGVPVYELTGFKKNGQEIDYFDIPAESFVDGKIEIRIDGDGSAPVAVSDIWLKESGRDFLIEDTPQIIPTSFKLEQNFPNPFNPSTVISYSLPKNSSVSLIVFDMLGRKVKTLVNGFSEAGVHSIRFDGNRLASGVYFYQLKSGDFIETRKMLYVR